jgi:hypothetical protein
MNVSAMGSPPLPLLLLICPCYFTPSHDRNPSRLTSITQCLTPTYNNVTINTLGSTITPNGGGLYCLAVHPVDDLFDRPGFTRFGLANQLLGNPPESVRLSR